MRPLPIVVIAVSLVAGACSGPNPGPTTFAPQSSAASTPGATSGIIDALTPASWHEVTVPAGTRLRVILDTAVGSDTSRIEQPVHAHLSSPVVLRGQTVLPEGTAVHGVVTDATPSGRVKGRAHVEVRFDTLALRADDERYRIQTTPVGRTAAATKKKDALEIAGSAGGGALIGALLGGKKGALIGTAAGGGAGTALVLSTSGKEIHLLKGTPLTLRLSEPITIRVS